MLEVYNAFVKDERSYLSKIGAYENDDEKYHTINDGQTTSVRDSSTGLMIVIYELLVFRFTTGTCWMIQGREVQAQPVQYLNEQNA